MATQGNSHVHSFSKTDDHVSAETKLGMTSRSIQRGMIRGTGKVREVH